MMLGGVKAEYVSSGCMANFGHLPRPSVEASEPIRERGGERAWWWRW